MNWPLTSARTSAAPIMSSSQLPSHSPLTLLSSVADVLREHPDSMHIFDELEIDTCCGGMATLDAAARNVQVVPADLVSMIRRRIGLDGLPGTPGTPSLADVRAGSEA